MYLHEQGEGCTEDAIDLASENGHFDIVKFLCQNRIEGFTEYAIDSSYENNHIQISDYLCDNCHILI